MLIVVDELRVLVQEPLPLHTLPVLLGLAEHTAHGSVVLSHVWCDVFCDMCDMTCCVI